MEVPMFSESSMFLRNGAAERRCASESGGEVGAVQKLVAVLLSLVIAVGTAFVVAMPFALLHLR
jgi:hypothetical protein